jgi:hypothetical protein
MKQMREKVATAKGLFRGRDLFWYCLLSDGAHDKCTNILKLKSIVMTFIGRFLRNTICFMNEGEDVLGETQFYNYAALLCIIWTRNV